MQETEKKRVCSSVCCTDSIRLDRDTQLLFLASWFWSDGRTACDTEVAIGAEKTEACVKAASSTFKYELQTLHHPANKSENMKILPL